MNLNQCDYLECKETFSFKINGKGRTTTFKQGQIFWVVSTQGHFAQYNTYIIARKGKNAAYGVEFTPEIVKRYFEVLS